jgi:hypothetical protein
MRLTIIIALLSLFSFSSFSQTQVYNKSSIQKGKLYIYWGWNWSWYTKSDITFKGNNYDFTLDNVVAKDRQSPFDANIYLNPANATIPQYNFRVGYFINDHYNISFGIDHMKYVVQNGQSVKISGHIDSTGAIYDGVYNNDDIILSEDFLKFEHTDGLNYPNIEFRRFDQIFAVKNFNINVTEGLGVGILYPKTNTTLLHNERYDEFHIAGFGFSGVVAVNFTFLKWFFVQSEFKGGYITMPDIRTTNSTYDKASQDFFFGSVNVVFGATIKLGKKINSTKDTN